MKPAPEVAEQLGELGPVFDGFEQANRAIPQRSRSQCRRDLRPLPGARLFVLALGRAVYSFSARAELGLGPLDELGNEACIKFPRSFENSSTCWRIQLVDGEL